MDQAKMFSTLERRVRFDINGPWGTIPGTLRLPFQSGLNPVADSTDAQNILWCARLGLLGEGNALAERIARARFHQLAALCHREGDREELALLTNFYTVGFVLEDSLAQVEFTAEMSEQVEELVAHLCAALSDRCCSPLPAGLPARAQFEAVATAYSEIARRLVSRCGGSSMRHYLSSMRDYIEGSIDAAVRGDVRVARTSDYSKLRLGFDAVTPVLELIALMRGIELDEEVREQAQFKAMREATSLCVVYINDLFGHAAETSACRNLVTVHTKSYGMPLRAAMHAAMRISDRVVGQYFSAKARLEQGAGFDAASEAFVGSMQACIRGTFDWHNQRPSAPRADYTIAVPAA